MKLDDNKIIKAFYLKVKTPLHAGAGEGNGKVDCAIQRENYSGLPKVDGFTWKGALTNNLSEKLRKEIRDEKRKTRLSFSDLKILLFPVKSYDNIYSLVTCPGVIQRFLDDLFWQNYLKDEDLEKFHCKEKFEGPYAYCWNNKIRKEYETIGNYRYHIRRATGENPFLLLKFGNSILDKVRIISDCDFKYLIQQKSEISIRNKIKIEKDEKKGALFIEEYLPSESILYGFAMESMGIVPSVNEFVLEKIMKELKNNKEKIELQMGKNTTLGKGQVELQEVLKDV